MKVFNLLRKNNRENSPRGIVITPTIGTSHLAEAIESVQNQKYKDVLHLIVVDGSQFSANTDRVLKKFNSKKYAKIVLPFNTANGMAGLRFNGHRIYAACSYLVNSEFVFFLDEDNWFDRNHVGSLIELIEDEKLDWAYSLRKIYSQSGSYITDDDCENLGRWPPFSRHSNLVDTNCYAIRRNVLTSVGHYWHHPLGADRVFYKHLSTGYANYKTSSLYTVNYRLHENRPPNAEFFLSGNKYMLAIYQNKLPWKNK